MSKVCYAKRNVSEIQSCRVLGLSESFVCPQEVIVFINSFVDRKYLTVQESEIIKSYNMFYSQKFRCIVHVITKTKISLSIVIYQHQRETNKRKDQVPTLMNNILDIGCCVPSKVSARLPIITFSSYAVFYTTLSIFIIIVLFSSIHRSTNKPIK